MKPVEQLLTNVKPRPREKDLYTGLHERLNEIEAASDNQTTQKVTAPSESMMPFFAMAMFAIAATILVLLLTYSPLFNNKKHQPIQNNSTLGAEEEQPKLLPGVTTWQFTDTSYDFLSIGLDATYLSALRSEHHKSNLYLSGPVKRIHEWSPGLGDIDMASTDNLSAIYFDRQGKVTETHAYEKKTGRVILITKYIFKDKLLAEIQLNKSGFLMLPLNYKEEEAAYNKLKESLPENADQSYVCNSGMVINHQNENNSSVGFYYRIDDVVYTTSAKLLVKMNKDSSISTSWKRGGASSEYFLTYDDANRLIQLAVTNSSEEPDDYSSDIGMSVIIPSKTDIIYDDTNLQITVKTYNSNEIALTTVYSVDENHHIMEVVKQSSNYTKTISVKYSNIDEYGNWTTAEKYRLKGKPEDENFKVELIGRVKRQISYYE